MNRPRQPNPPPSLSLVVPAYNEAGRIAATLREATAYLAAQPFATEVILVDDGSTDATGRIARDTLAGRPNARVLTIPHGGKAAAVRAGMAEARLEQVLFADADLATPLAAVHELRAVLAGGCDVAIGSREGVGAHRIGEPVYRHLMGRAFNGLVRVLLLRGIADTQCGFKLFRREAARAILARTRLYRDDAPISGPRVTAFDVELLVVARSLGLTVCPVPVVWTYGPGSQVHPIKDSWHNMRDLLRVWNHWKRGRYR